MPWIDAHSSLSLSQFILYLPDQSRRYPPWARLVVAPIKEAAHWVCRDHHARTEPPPRSGAVPASILPPGDAPRNPGKAMETGRGKSAEPVAQPLADAEGGASNGGYILCAAAYSTTPATPTASRHRDHWRPAPGST